MEIDTLLPKKLDKEDAPDSYKSVQELDKVLLSAKELHIKNIALTGPYGSGKSSVLTTLMEDFPNRRNYLPISLATLQANEEGDKGKNIGGNNNENDGSFNEKRIENLNRKIEYSILQQLIYREKAKTVPNSRFRRIVHLSKCKLFWYSFCVVFSLICFFVLFEPKFVRVESIYNFFYWGDTWNLVFDFVAATYLLLMLFIVTRYVFKSYSNSKLNKLNLKDGEIEIVEDNSIFNRHLDEILYFFQVTKYDVVIIEDLDRFGTPNIFLKLRELNQLINESKIVGRHITFIYAVKDDIFKDEERTKFFDYIITVIPVINPSNSKDKLKAALKAKGCDNEISDDDLSEMAFFIQDMRILTNIVNEYKQYRDKLCANQGVQLNKTKLLAMIVYKNYYPQDFALLHRREGKIYECINSKKLFVKESEEKLKAKENEVARKEKDFLNNLHLQIKDIRLLLLCKWKKTIAEKLHSIYIDSHYYQLEEIADDEILFEKLLSMEKVQYQYRNYYDNISTTSTTNNIKSYSSFFEKIELLKSGKKSINSEYKQINNEKLKINSLRISELLTKYELGKTLAYQNLKLSDMQDIFIRRGYIDEDYYDYISYFYPGMISSEDRALLLSMKRQIAQSYDCHIDKIDNFVKELKEYMFESDAILNIELLDYLATCKEHKSKFVHFMSRLERENAPLKFLSEYYTEGKQGEIVFEYYIENVKNTWTNFISWENVDERNNLIEAYLKYCIKLSDDSQEWLNGNFKFLVEHIDGITFERASQLVENSYFDKLCHESDELLDCVVKKQKYAINLNNLFVITKHLSKDIATLTEESLNYTRIIETNNKEFIDHVNDNISTVIQELKNINNDDSSDSLLYILNSEHIDSSIKEQYLTNAINRINNFNSIKDVEYFDIAIKTLIVLPTWNNISFYFSNCNEDISKIFYDYINHYADELSKEKYSDEFSYKNDIYVLLFGNNTLSMENYKKLLSSFDGIFPNVNLLTNLDPDRWCVLIDRDRIPFDQSTLDVINKVTSKKDYILSNYILHNSKLFLQYLDWEYNFNVDNIEVILDSKKFSSKEKYDIIGIIPIDVIKESQSIVNTIVNIFCEEQNVNIDFDKLLSLLEKASDKNKKIELITNLLIKSDYNQEKIRQLLDTLGVSYTEVGDKTKRPLLTNDTLHKNLLDTLAKIRFISSYKEEEKNPNMLRVLR